MNAQVQEARQVAPYLRAIGGSKEKFVTIADERTFDVESLFAMQLLTKTDYAMKIANENPQSVRNAMFNVASTGLTLNPANAYAYLVPRDGAIMLDISYKGLIKIATDAGSILWARAEVVHADDKFTYNGPAAMPEHHANPFKKDRGDVIGAYCIARTVDGDVLTEVMDMTEIEKIRGKSMSYAKKKSGPWVEWFGEMVRKTVIKRASKTWPYSSRMEKLHEAIEIANNAEGGYDMEGTAVVLVSERQAANLRDALDASGMDVARFLALFDVEAIDALPASRYTEAVKTLEEARAAA